jgi:hypothetical protein
MRGRRRAVASCAVLATLATLATLPACSSSTGSSAQNDDGGTPPGQPRSFRRDVVPIFAQSCASQDCHGDTKNDLGIHFVPSDPDGIYAELQRESPTAKGVKFVMPGDPTKSFLFAKINGDEGDYTAMCAPPDCGETMPPGTKIPSVQRDTIRQWILEGATKD